ncbi:GNAT family N-acetyltransferase [Bradyrhizobium brasilense]|uniref:GNAT family N-acetyltransferase n=1 Tax=Bradyrhizobium brasilense TaxID=1419277 RepID=UPI0024B1F4B7|nr:GNAT family N-acetyltransferase [Bradyrhizobium australafricanum]WFU31343.1 GNAT family N-acetyltransferase [Bradyrhizobium australafricanum]
MSSEGIMPVITLTDAPDRKAEEIIEEGLAQFNEEKAGYRDSRPLAVLLSDPESNAVVGGLLGRTSLGLLYINWFFLPASVRNRGLGGRIIVKAEDEARQRGCCKAVVRTISFQAPEFYQRHGYRVLGQTDCKPGMALISLIKELL